MYVSKPAYLQMQEKLAHILTDGIYRLSSQSSSNRVLNVYNTTASIVGVKIST
jgi:hypothetical protein